MKRKTTKTNSQIQSLIDTIIKQDIKVQSKNKTLQSFLGYNLKKLKTHLEKHFETGMNWNNYGQWQIEHIIPKSTFGKTNKAIKKCFSLNNLKPVWKKNITKKENQKRADFFTNEIMQRWNKGESINKINKHIPLSLLTIRHIIKNEIGKEAYKKRCIKNMTKAHKK